MNKIRAFFNQSYPISRKPGIVIILSSVLVLFILGLFQPFGLNNLSSVRKWPIILGFTGVTAFSTAIVGYIFPLLFKRFYNPENWTNGKNLLNNIWIILVIGLGNFIFDWVLTDRPYNTFIPLLTAYLIITFLVGIFPAVFISILIQNRNLKQNLSDAREMNKSLLDKLQKTDESILREESVLVQLSGNTKEGIELYPEDILYIEASGNYVQINYKTGSEPIKQKQIRATIAQIEKDLESFSFMVRCHRAFLINTSCITNVEGNSQGFLLNLRHTEKLVPVSRSYTKDLRRILQM